MRTCTKCKKYKKLADFGKYNRGRDGLRAQCKNCHNKANKNYYRRNINYYQEVSRKSHLKRCYNIDEETFKKKLIDQGGVCAICKGDNEGKTLHVDHCHNTGQVRGLLCMNCNRGIGHMQDNPGILKSAADYCTHWIGVI